MKLTITTTIGNIRIELFPDKAPQTVANFLRYVDAGFYTNTIFHRLIPDFVIQGGGVDFSGDTKTNRFDPIQNEAKNGLSNKKYTIAMARPPEDGEAATCEFFINMADNGDSLDHHPTLNPGFAVFGQVISGFDIVDKIAHMRTCEHGIYPTYPVDPVVILNIAFSTDPVKPVEQAPLQQPAAPIVEEPIVQEEIVIEHPLVVLETNLGKITLELFPEHAPATVENFLEYVRDGFYEGLIFHRVIKNFVIQAGGYNSRLVSQKRRPEIKFEGDNGLSNLAYSVAMARGQTLNSASSEFYINLSNNTALDHEQRRHDSGGYCVFGTVIDGFELVDAIGEIAVEAKNFHEHVPVTPVMIEKAYVVGDEEKTDDSTEENHGETEEHSAE